MGYTVDGRKIIQQKYHYIQYITISIITIPIKYCIRFSRIFDIWLPGEYQYISISIRLDRYS